MSPRASAVILLAVIAAAAATASIPDGVQLSLKPYRVLAYQNQAQVWFSAEAVLSAGSAQTLLLNGIRGGLLSSAGNDHSIRVADQPDLRVRQVAFVVEAGVAHHEDEIKALQASVKDVGQEQSLVEGRIADTTSAKNTYQKAADFMLTGSIPNATIHNLIEGLDAAANKVAGLTAQIHALEQRKESLRDNMTNLLNAISALQRQNETVRLVVDVAKSGTYRINATRTVPFVSWRPAYDVAAETDIANASDALTLSLDYYAVLSQSTGFDWDDVEVELCTGLPNSQAPPELQPWKLAPRAPQAWGQELLLENRARKFASSARTQRGKSEYNQLQNDDEYAGHVQFVTAAPDQLAGSDPLATASAVTEGTTTFFKLEARHTLRNGVEHRLRIAVVELKGKVDRIAAPKFSSYVYLRGKVNNTSPLTFVPGTAVVTLNGAYVGDSEMPLMPPGAAGKIPLGVDSSVTIARSSHKNRFTDPGGLFSQERPGWSIRAVSKLTSRHNAPIKVKLLELLPLPEHEDIQVFLNKPSTAAGSKPARVVAGTQLVFPASANVTLGATTGIMAWTGFVPKQSTAEFTLAYDVIWTPTLDIGQFDLQDL